MGSKRGPNAKMYVLLQCLGLEADWIWGIVWVWVSCTDVSQRLYLLAQVRGC